MKKTLGGDRLGSGSKMQIELHNYERSTHDLSYIWRSTMSSGTLVPFMKLIALPGDTFDINLGQDIKTHPTTGPLFGSYKAQSDVFIIPLRLYQGQLHNNKTGIGMDMASVKFPLVKLTALEMDITDSDNVPEDVDNCQINPSSLLAYLGIRGIGMSYVDNHDRYFNANAILAYYDIVKCYYSNKQEEKAVFIHAAATASPETVSVITIDGQELSQFPTLDPQPLVNGSVIQVEYTGASPNYNTINIILAGNEKIPINIIASEMNQGAGVTTWTYNWTLFGDRTANNWNYQSSTTPQQLSPTLVDVTLDKLDGMREYLLTHMGSSAIEIGAYAQPPYSWLNGTSNSIPFRTQSQEGLAVKTYQSDIFNNWLSTEWIDGSGGINEITAVSTTGDSFNIDALMLARKVYDLLMRIAVSGGTYDDWIDAVYTHDRYVRPETPVYMGGLIKELVFQEVVSNSATQDGQQPLGTLAGKGIMAQKHKGGNIYIKVDEPSLIMGITSLTPRLDYSQGNDWDIHLLTMDDLHKPGLDQIGFQELITEQMVWWDTYYDTGEGKWIQKSAGKQPAWLNYMTAYNKTYGNFAIEDNEMFMTLNRKYAYTINDDKFQIQDLTTYIDPVKYNQIFAQSSIDAQNFWVQLAVNITARRKMSAKLMPNL